MKRILTVENEVQISALLYNLFSSSGTAIEHAVEIDSAIASMQRHHADVVVINASTPEIEWLAGVHQIHSNHPRTKIIFLSGAGHIGPEEYLATAHSLGAYAAFAKPVCAEMLEQEIRKVIELPDALHILQAH